MISSLILPTYIIEGLGPTNLPLEVDKPGGRLPLNCLCVWSLNHGHRTVPQIASFPPSTPQCLSLPT